MATNIGIVWSDIDHRLALNAQGEIKIVNNMQAVMSSIDNIIRTYRGERVMLPEFGSGLQNVAFEQIDDDLADLISRDIKDVIEIWDDRVTVTKISYLPEPDSNSIALKISFIIKGYTQIFQYVSPIQGEVN